MTVIARVQDSEGQHEITLRNNGIVHSLTIAPKATGFGSSVSGGELLCLALATCFCNDIYREAEIQGIIVEQVEVEAEADFIAEGEPARNVTFRAKVMAQATEDEIMELMRVTNRVAEIQNTVREATQVTLSGMEAVSV
jgi:uncharacterized OsmC-like protein